MIEMNPYYASESDVGPVFDVATFSRRKAFGMGLSALVVAAVIGLVATYVWNPNLVYPNAPQWFADGNRETLQLWKDHPRGTPLAVGAAGVIAAFLVLASLSYLFQALTGEFFVRVGEGGISFRVPRGFDTLALDVPWDDVAELKVTQVKKLGSLSQSSGNVSGNFTLVTHAHGDHFISLDDFREPAYLIYDRIQEARATRPAELACSC